jgi:hypothetical protein
MKNKHFLNNIIIIILLSAYSGIGYSQPVTWYRTWGLPGFNRGEEGKRVCQTYDGGYAVLCLVSRGGDTWFDLLKYDYLGNLQWVNVIIDSTVTNRQLCDMQQTSDSGFIFTGWLPAGQGALLVKTDKNGNLKWQRNYTNLNSGERFNSVQQIKDKGYITCGNYIDYVSPSTKGIVTKVDSLGYIQWENQYMDSTFNSYSEIIQGLDNNYYIAGATANNQSPYYSLLKKLDTLGNVINTNIFYQKSYIGYIIQLKDSSLITGGEDETTNTNYPLIAKFSQSGNMKWIKTYTIPYNEQFYFYDMNKDFFDNVIILGNSEKLGYNATIETWKLDTSGTLLKAKKFIYSGYSIIGANCIRPTIDTGYIIAGIITLLGNHDALLIKTDSAFNSPLITGLINNQITVSDKFEVFNNYPNPFNTSTLIKFYLLKNGITNFEIYDLIGKKVSSHKQYYYSGINEYFIDFNKYNLSSGVYFVRINFEDESKLIKLIFLK